MKFINKIKSISLLFGLVAIGTASLVGCGNNSKEDISSISLEDLKEHSSKEKIYVSLWHVFDRTSSSILDGIITQFEQIMAAQDIYIEISQQKVASDTETFEDLVLKSAPVKALPSIIIDNPINFADYYDIGILKPLNELVYSDNKDLSIDTDDFNESFFQSSFLKDVNGHNIIVGIPFSAATDVMYYNASVIDPILKDFGYGEDVNNTRIRSNPTWDQVANVSQVILNKINDGGVTWKYGFNEYSVNEPIVPTDIGDFFSFFLNTSKQWCDSAEQASSIYTNDKGQVTFRNETVLNAQEYFLENAYKGLWGKSDNAFINISPMSDVNYSGNYEFKCTTYPQKSYDSNSYQAAMQNGLSAALINDDDNYTNLAAYLFIKYLTNTMNNTDFSIQRGSLPIRNSVYDSEEFKIYYNSPFSNQESLKVLDAALEQDKYFYNEPALRNASEIKSAVSEMVNLIYFESNSIVDAMNKTYNYLDLHDIECI